MKLFDSYSQKLIDFVPIDDKKVKMYVCGPTVYDHPHLGHARCYITWDVAYRYLQFKGYDVTYVRNVTDVDDKIIKKAMENNVSPAQIAEKYYKIFQKAMAALNVASPTIEPKATQTIAEMIEIIKTLVTKGFAYSVNGDVYFRVNKFPKYGKLSKQSISDLEAGARIETSVQKENPLDFALWKSVKTPDEISWESPWGKGRPGWHIECSAMAKKYLGETIDIHAGGQDLLFPHHENEIAQSECSCGREFVKYWLHNGFVRIGNEKMSKSLGNFITIDDVLDKYDANTVRFFILTNHYRMPVEFNDESLRAAKAGMKRLKNAFNDVANIVGEEKIIEAVGLVSTVVDDIAKKGCIPFYQIDKSETEYKIPADITENLIKLTNNFIAAMDDDFNTSKALAVLFELASMGQKLKDLPVPDNSAYAIGLLVKLSSILGFDLIKCDAENDDRTGKLMNLLINLRNDARAEKNWSMSDKIRDELKNIGIIMKDSKEGTSWSIED